MSHWVVLLLGGASGVGKSMMSYRLASRLGVDLTEIDDIQNRPRSGDWTRAIAAVALLAYELR